MSDRWGVGFLFESYTAGSLRVLSRAEDRARERQSLAVDLIDLAAGLADEPESHAATLADEMGLSPEAMLVALGRSADPPTLEPTDDILTRVPLSPETRSVLVAASSRAKGMTRGSSVGTEHILSALLSAGGPITAALVEAGLQVDALLASLDEAELDAALPIPLAGDIAPLEINDPGGEVDLFRILDASANRAREGLRVVEDHVRFALDDPALTRRLKEVRHRLADALKGLDPDRLLAARDTRGDVGTHIMTPNEQVRENPRAVLIANFKRTAEALRSLEEFAKLVDIWVSGRFEVLRYDVYTLEKLVLTAVAARRTWHDVNLMVLVGGLPTLGDLTWVVEEALAGGAGAIQLREKGLPDREYLTRAREVRILTSKARARFIMNDRPDLARLSGADAVHLGQDDVAPRDARRIVGPGLAIGISTHNPAQISKATLDGAGYLGVGPTFTSLTKNFDDLAGLDFVAEASQATGLPWFAIGGITLSNLDEVIEAGARRVAVSSAVLRAEFPRQAAAAFRRRLDQVAEAPDSATTDQIRP